MASLISPKVSLPREFSASPHPLKAPTLRYSSQFRLATWVMVPGVDSCRNARRRSPGVSVRAKTLDFSPALLKPPGMVVESDSLSSDVRRRAMDAVDSFGGRVTMGDVASKAGLKLSEAQRALQALASDTDGFLEVSFKFLTLFFFIIFICIKLWLIRGGICLDSASLSLCWN